MNQMKKNYINPLPVLSAQEVFDAHVVEVLSNGGYLDAGEFAHALGDKINLARLETFRSIQGHNKKVDTLLDAYWHLRGIRAFSEMENHVKANISKWKKIATPINFEELGLGSLLKHPKVMRLFGFDGTVTRSALHEFPLADLLKQLVKYLRESAIYTYTEAVGLEMMQFLKHSVPIGKVLATSLDGKEVFYACRSAIHAVDMRSTIKTIEAEYHMACAMKLRASFAAACVAQTNPLLTLIDRCEKLFPPALVPGNLQLKDFRRIACGMKPFDQTFLSICQTALRLTEGGGGLPLDHEHALAFLYQYQYPDDLPKSAKIQYKHTFLATVFSASIASLAFLLPAIAKELEQQPADALTDLDALIWGLRTAYTNDIPSFALEQLRKLLEKVTKAGCNVEYNENVFQVTKAEIDLAGLLAGANHLINDESATPMNSVKQGACGICNGRYKNLPAHYKADHAGENVEGILSLKENHLVATITAVIVYHRIMMTETVRVNHVEDIDVDDFFFERIESVICIDQEKVAQDGVTATVLTQLRNLEDIMLCDLEAVSFECLNQGSFLNYISQPEQLKELQGIMDSVLTVSSKCTDEDDPGHKQPELTEQDREMLQQVLPSALEELSASVLSSAGYTRDFGPISVLILLQQRVQVLAPAVGFISEGNFLSTLLNIMDRDQGIQFKVDELFGQLAPQAADAQNTEPSEAAVTSDEVKLSVLLDEVKWSLRVIRHAAVSFLCTQSATSQQASHSSNPMVLMHEAESYLVSAFSIPQMLAKGVIKETFNALRYHEKADRFTARRPSDGVPVLFGLERTIALGCFTADTVEEYMAQAEFSLPSPAEDEQVQWNDDILDCVLRSIAVVPFGVACAQFILWHEYFAEKICSLRDRAVSFLGFLVDQQSSGLVTHCNDSIFIVTCTDEGNEECIRLPALPAAAKELLKLFQEKNYTSIAVNSLSAFLHHHNDAEIKTEAKWEDTFRMNVRACVLELFESRGVDALSSLLMDVMCIGLALHSHLDSGSVFKEWLQVVASVARTSVEYVQKQAWSDVVQSSADQDKARYLATIGCKHPMWFPYLKTVGEDFASNRAEHLKRLVIPTLSMPKLARVSPSVSSTVDAQSIHEDAPVDVDLSEGDQTRDGTISKKLTIFRLLQSEFHYDAQGKRPSTESPEGRKLRNSLDLLSASLYSSDVHFVMELMQNADDNMYPDGTIPTLKLQLFPHALVIFNNEVGFEEDNIVAVCNVGGSTKQGLTGYIGQKGIGFKSVFSISDRPEIHSNGYHIMFDKSISMLEPIWLDDVEHGRSLGKWPVKIDSVDGTYFETCLRLVLSEDALKNVAKLTSDMEQVFDGKLILFLNKLQRMVFDNMCKTASIEHLRDRINDSWTRIQSMYTNSYAVPGALSMAAGQACSDSYWWTVRKTISEPNIRRNNVKIDSTEVVLAFKFVAKTTHEEDVAQTVMTLDSKQGLLPIYAFLPTSTPFFRFIVQADFVLATNRESIMDGNDWNHLLLAEVPQLFVDAIRELSLWMQYGQQAESELQFSSDCPRLVSALNESRNIVVQAEDILSMIPRPAPDTQLGKHLHRTLSNIYVGLQDVAFLTNSSGQLCSPKAVLSTRHLAFDPSQYLSSDIMQVLLKRQLIHPDLQQHMDDELVEVLGIEQFNIEHVLACLVELQATFTQPLAAFLQEEHSVDRIVSGDHKKYLEVLSGLLLILNAIIAPSTPHSSSHPPRLNQKPSLVPSQVQRPKAKATSVPVYSFLQKDVIVAIKKLPVWPLANGKCVSLDSNVVLLPQLGQALWSSAQVECLKVFQEDLKVLDDKLLFASNDKSTGNNSAKRSDILRSFLLNCFAPPSAISLGVKGNQQVGGFKIMSAEVIISSVVAPAYKSQDAENAAHLSREKSAAYLAFIYLCSEAGSLRLIESTWKDSGIVVPVLQAKDKGGKNSHELHWGQPQNVTMQAQPAYDTADVHLGLEFFDSATTTLSKQGTFTAFRQLGWAVVDPLVAGFVFGKQMHLLGNRARHVSAEDVLLSTDVQTAFASVQKSSRLVAWKEFLLSIGVVEFFSVRPIPRLEDSDVDGHAAELSHVPGLTRFLNHLVRHGSGITCSPPEDVTTDQDGEQPKAYLPLFLPDSFQEVGNVQLLSVSKDVYITIKSLVVPLVYNELRRHFPKDAMHSPVYASILQQLQNTIWFPIECHMFIYTLFKPLESQAAVSEKLFLLAAPKNIIAGREHRDLGKRLLGPHCIYLPADIHLLVDLIGCAQMFNMQVASIDVDQPFIFANLLQWMSKQGKQSLYSSVSFMRKLYSSLHRCFKDGADARAVALVSQLLSSNSSMMWIPDSALEAQTIINEFYCGKMIALSSIVKDDKANFLPEEGPIKVLSKYYPPDTIQIFARKVHCFSCKAVEGMFGVRGLPKDRAVSTVNPCSCVDKDSFGAYFTSLPGLVADSATLSQVVELMSWHTQQWQSATEASVKAQHMVEMVSLLNSISGNVWKCFHIKRSLHPYSAEQLTSLLKGFETFPLLPTYGHRSFASMAMDCETKSFLAVDDSTVYETLQADLARLGESTILLDAGLFSEDSGKGIARIINTFFINDRLGVVQNIEYNMDELAVDSTDLINAPPSEFYQLVRNISALTFFAPKHMLPLLKLLRIPLLSDSVAVKMHKEVKETVKKGEIGCSVLLAAIFNDLLPLTQAFFLKHMDTLKPELVSGSDAILLQFPNLVKQLWHSRRMQKLLHAKLYECSTLQRHLKLSVGNISAESVVDDPISIVSVEDSSSFYALFLQETLPLDLLGEIAVTIIIQVLRVEISLLTMNQQVELLQSLEGFLRKFADVDAREIPMLVKFEKLDKYYKPVEVAKEGDPPAVPMVWAMFNPITLVEENVEETAPPAPAEVVLEEVETEDERADSVLTEVVQSEEDLRQEAERKDAAKVAYQKLKQDAIERSKAMQAAPKHNSSTATPPSLQVPQVRQNQSTTGDQSHTRKAAVNAADSVNVASKESASVVPSLPAPLLGQKQIVEYEQHHAGGIGRGSHIQPDMVCENVIERVLITSDTSNDAVAEVGQQQSLSKPRSVVYWKAGTTTMSAVKNDHPPTVSNPSHTLPQATAGAQSGAGRWNPLVALAQPTGSGVLQDVSVPQNVVQSLLDRELNNNQLYTDQADGEQPILPLVNNSLSGRIGEGLARAYLRSLVGHAIGGVVCVKAMWMNETAESGLPYDIELHFSNQVVKRCEVKTRSTISRSTQWKISPAEVQAAHSFGQHYFCVLVQLQMDYHAGQFSVQSISLLGLETGLLHCLHHDMAHLFLQINSDAQEPGPAVEAK